MKNGNNRPPGTASATFILQNSFSDHGQNFAGTGMGTTDYASQRAYGHLSSSA